MSTIPVKRPLADLTREECQTLFALAFGYAPELDLLDTSTVLGLMSFGDDTFGMTLGTDGTVLAWRSEGESPVAINVRKLISNLDAMNVAFGCADYQPVFLNQVAGPVRINS